MSSKKRPSEVPEQPESHGTSATPERVPTERANLWLMRGALVVLLVAVGVGSFWMGQRKTYDYEPFETCEASLETIDGYLYGLGAGIEAKVALKPELVEARPSQYFELGEGFSILGQALEMSPCELEGVVDHLEIEGRDEPLRTVLALVVADHVGRVADVDLDSLPGVVREIVATTDTPGGQRAQMVTGEYATGDLIVVLVGDNAHCDCYAAVDEAAELLGEEIGAKARVYVVDEDGAVAQEVTDRYGWSLIDATEVPGRWRVEARPTVLFLRNGVEVARLEGAEQLGEAPNALEVFEYPLDPAAQEVHLRLLPRVEACDGYRAGGVIINESDRPIHAMVMTDPNVFFAEDGWPVSSRVYHDLGPVEPYGHVFFDVKTGSEHYAPCWVATTAVYTDGEWRDQGSGPENPSYPPGFTSDPEALIEREGFDLPRQVIPAGLFPTADDVRHISEGHPADEEEGG